MEPREEEKTKHALLAEVNVVLAEENYRLKQHNTFQRGLVIVLEESNSALSLENEILKEHNIVHKEEIRLLEEQNTRIMDLLKELTNTLESLKEEKPPEGNPEWSAVVGTYSSFAKFGIPKEIALGQTEPGTPSPTPRRFVVEVSQKFSGSDIAVSITDRDKPHLNTVMEIDRFFLERAKKSQNVYMELANGIVRDARDKLVLADDNKARWSLRDQVYQVLSKRIT